MNAALDSPVRVLVTGAAGFVGRHLLPCLRTAAPHASVTGTDLRLPPAYDCASWVRTDLADRNSAAQLIGEVRPDCVIHLAGTFGGDDRAALTRANVAALAGLLYALRQHAPHAVVVTTGSAAEYGRVPADRQPVTEDTPCEPVTEYGRTKHAATTLARDFGRAHGLCVMIVRPFQLLGRGLSARLAPGAFAEQVQRAARGELAAMRVGNLESGRDFLDVRDAVGAIWQLCQKPAPGEVFNVCAGRATRVGDLLDLMRRCRGVTVPVEIDPQRLRGPAEIDVLYGSFHKLHQHCGWRPRISLADSVAGLLAGT